MNILELIKTTYKDKMDSKLKEYLMPTFKPDKKVNEH